MSPQALDPKPHVHDLVRKADELLDELRELSTAYQVQHHFMHCLIRHIRDATTDPAQFANTTFVDDFLDDGGNTWTVLAHVTVLEARKRFVGAEMQKIQAASKELRVQRTEVLKAHEKLLRDGPDVTASARACVVVVGQP